MMEFLAGLGLGLCAGIVGTFTAMIYMKGQGYEITRTEKLTGREAEELDKALEDVRTQDKALGERVDAVCGLLEEQNQRISELAVGQRQDHDRLEKVVDVVTLDKEGE